MGGSQSTLGSSGGSSSQDNSTSAVLFTAAGGAGASTVGGVGGGNEGGTFASGGTTSTSSGGSGGAFGMACDSGGARVAVDGSVLCFAGTPFHVRGVNWNPVPKGGAHPADLDYAGFADRDIPLMAAAGINAVRTYEPLVDVEVLDELAAAGIYVFNTVYPNGNDDPANVRGRVASLRDHDAILVWVIGNEWNYNGIYADLSHDQAVVRLNEVAAAIQAEDDQHPVATIYGELPSRETLDAMPDIDLWGVNAYRGISFGELFADWSARSDKPMFLGEYGADAYNANLPGYDPDSQAEATVALTQEVSNHSRAGGGSGPCVGGLVFEWADEWWKVQGSPLDTQDPGGTAPGGGPYPDQTFNEEYWGIVDIDRTPRPAYDGLRSLFLEKP